MTSALPPCPPSPSDDDPLREVAYLRRLAERTTARLMATDLRAFALRRELERKRRGFRLMAELAVTLGQDADYGTVFQSVSRRVNAALNMQRTAVLRPAGDDGFRVEALQGYPPGDREAVLARRVPVGAELLDPLRPALVTALDPPERLAAFRAALALPYLIAVPVRLQGEAAAVFVTGRVAERRPYLPRLGASDVETVRAVGAYLAAILAGQRLRQAESLAKHDPLTELPNLRGTHERLQQILALARRGGFLAATMFVDLDRFKDVNDAHGHATGDEVLRVAARRLTHCVRGSDFVGRIGGDEFVVALAHVKRAEDAGIVARKIVDELAEPIHAGGAACAIGASIGIAIFPDHGDNEAALLRAADEAMYSVKDRGRNAFAYAAKPSAPAAPRQADPSDRPPA